MVGGRLTNVIGNASRRHLYGAKEGTDAMPPSDQLRFEVFHSGSHPLGYITSSYPSKLPTTLTITATVRPCHSERSVAE